MVVTSPFTLGANDPPSRDRTRVADAVRALYERYPYPPPVDDLDAYARRCSEPGRRRAESLLFWPDEPYRDDRRILVAGCGTSQAAKYALRWPSSQVTGIDVSETSLQHAETLKRRYGLENVTLRLLPVERATELDRSFDLVVCTGVLHHLPDPDAGLVALRDVMSPCAAMELMVYAPYGRVGIYLLQEYCRRLGLGPAGENIRGLAASLRSLPQDHPFAALLRHAPDLQHEAGLADALLHPSDRPCSVPQFLELLERNALCFGRWRRQAPYLPHCGAIAASPHYQLLTQLAAEEQYAALELFRGTMIRHTAIVYRGDRTGGAQPGDFARSAEWVPVRVPDTLVVSRNAPAGAAAVLINPRHTYTDLYLPVTEDELGLVESVDGVRSIGDVADAGTGFDAARALFERLWWYDQVVFDTSARSRDPQTAAGYQG
jgi:SAM-dependent methyltransferase